MEWRKPAETDASRNRVRGPLLRPGARLACEDPGRIADAVPSAPLHRIAQTALPRPAPLHLPCETFSTVGRPGPAADARNRMHATFGSTQPALLRCGALPRESPRAPRAAAPPPRQPCPAPTCVGTPHATATPHAASSRARRHGHSQPATARKGMHALGGYGIEVPCQSRECLLK
jgi:hypothetical protein